MESDKARPDHLKPGSLVKGYEAAIAGAISGGVARMVTAPLDTMKIRLQLQESKKSALVIFKQLIRHEGPMALWKGNVPAEIMYILYGVAQFSSYQFLNNQLNLLSKHQNITIPSSLHSLLAGTLAGGMSTLITYPFDLLRTRLAANSSKRFLSMTSTVFQVIKKEGIAGCFSGIKPAILSVALNTGIMFGTYDKIMDYSKQFPQIPFIEAICGFIAGATSKALTFPLDTLRKRCQMYGVANSDKTSAWKISKNIISNEGVLGFYKGFGISVLKTAPTTAVSLYVYEYSLNAIQARFV